MNLRLSLRLNLDGGTDAKQEAVRQVVLVESRKFTAALADAIEETGIEVEIEGVDRVLQSRWRRLLRT